MLLRKVWRILRSLVNPVPRCYGPDFHRYYAFLQGSQWWDSSALIEYQNCQLTDLIRHCYQNVPYYRKLFEQYGYTPSTIESVQDLRKLPYLTREIVRDNLSDLVAKNIPKQRLELHTTGGTSGSPLGIYIEERTNLIRLAFEWRFYNWGGYNFGDRCVVLRGVRVSDFGKGRRWEYDPENHYLILSTFDMTEDNMQAYLSKINEFRPKVVRGYPSALERLAKFAVENGNRINMEGNIKAIYTSSETLYPYQREAIGKAFQAEVFDLYGNTEQAGRFGECNRHEGYHDFSEYGVTEIENQQLSGTGEIIATTFTNYAMPLIRYKTGDCAAWALDRCSCGRGLRLIKNLEGRLQDKIVLRDGTPVPLTSFFFAVHVPEMAMIRKIQFRQEEPGYLKVLVVKNRNYQQGACESMLSKMNENLRQKLDISVVFVEDIDLTASGKHRFFVQENEAHE